MHAVHQGAVHGPLRHESGNRAHDRSSGSMKTAAHDPTTRTKARSRKFRTPRLPLNQLCPWRRRCFATSRVASFMESICRAGTPRGLEQYTCCIRYMYSPCTTSRRGTVRVNSCEIVRQFPKMEQDVAFPPRTSSKRGFCLLGVRISCALCCVWLVGWLVRGSFRNST